MKVVELGALLKRVQQQALRHRSTRHAGRWKAKLKFSSSLLLRLLLSAVDVWMFLGICVSQQKMAAVRASGLS